MADYEAESVKAERFVIGTQKYARPRLSTVGDVRKLLAWVIYEFRDSRINPDIAKTYVVLCNALRDTIIAEDLEKLITEHSESLASLKGEAPQMPSLPYSTLAGQFRKTGRKGMTEVIGSERNVVYPAYDAAPGQPMIVQGEDVRERSYREDLKRPDSNTWDDSADDSSAGDSTIE